MTFASNSSGQPCARRHDARALCLLIALVILVAACSKSNDLPATSGYSLEVAEEIETPFPVLTELLRSVPVAVIDLDDLPEPMAIEPEVIIGGEHAAGGETLFLAEPWGAVVAGDSVVILDRGQEALFVADLEGRLVRRVGRRGQAPGEFSEISHLTANGEYVFVYDHGNRRVQVFDHILEYQTSIPANYLPTGTGLVATHSSLYIPNMVHSDHLVSGYRTMPPFSHERDLFPQLRPQEVNAPLAHNMLRLASNSEELICGNYEGLPQVICYGEGDRPIYALAFEGDALRALRQTPPAGTRVTRPDALVRSFTRTMAISDHTLYLMHPQARLFLAVDLRSGAVSGVLSPPEVLNPWRLSVSDDYLIVTDVQGARVWLFNLNHLT